MATIATEKYRYSHLVKEELWHEKGYCTKQVTVNDAAQTLALGTVLGQVTVGGKYKVAKETASDGSKVGAAIVVEAITIPATTDTKVLVMYRGPAEVSKGALVIDATYNDATKLGVLYADFEAKGIQVSDAA
jgi:hypothetical protein